MTITSTRSTGLKTNQQGTGQKAQNQNEHWIERPKDCLVQRFLTPCRDTYDLFIDIHYPSIKFNFI